MLCNLFTGYGGGTRHQHVLHPELHRVDPELPGYNVHIPFHAPQELQMAKAPVGRTEYLISVHHIGVNLAVENLVGTRTGIGCRPTDIDPVIGIGTGIPVGPWQY
ncbi:hypothetical protein ES703_114190 [subsurface metagenome]